MSLVLIVDDDVDVRRVLKRWIGGAGHELVEADSTAAALEVLAERPAGVVFCDVQMPGDHNGLWLAGELRRAIRRQRSYWRRASARCPRNQSAGRRARVSG